MRRHLECKQVKGHNELLTCRRVEKENERRARRGSSINEKERKDNDYENNVERNQEGHEGIHCKLSECNVTLWRSYLQK